MDGNVVGKNTWKNQGKWRTPTLGNGAGHGSALYVR